MDGDGSNPPGTLEERRNIQVDNAIRAIREKKPLPEIDFTIHTMEDGTQVRTGERVCKGIVLGACPARGASASAPFVLPPHLPLFAKWHATDRNASM